MADWRAGSLPAYDYAFGPEYVLIVDTRPGNDRSVLLSGLSRDLILLCDTIQSREGLRAELSALYPAAVEDGTFDRTIDDLIASDILMTEGNQLLTLPIAKKPRSTEELRRRVFGTAYSMEPPAALKRSPALA